MEAFKSVQVGTFFHCNLGSVLNYRAFTHLWPEDSFREGPKEVLDEFRKSYGCEYHSMLKIYIDFQSNTMKFWDILRSEDKVKVFRHFMHTYAREVQMIADASASEYKSIMSIGEYSNSKKSRNMLGQFTVSPSAREKRRAKNTKLPEFYSQAKKYRSYAGLPEPRIQLKPIEIEIGEVEREEDKREGEIDMDHRVNDLKRKFSNFGTALFSV